MKLKKISYYTIYDTFFPMNKTKIQPKVLESPWITKGMKKSSKKNQLLFSKLKKKKWKNEKRISRLQKAFSIY